jgi:hypothetical protein
VITDELKNQIVVSIKQSWDGIADDVLTLGEDGRRCESLPAKSQADVMSLAVDYWAGRCWTPDERELYAKWRQLTDAERKQILLLAFPCKWYGY